MTSIINVDKSARRRKPTYDIPETSPRANSRFEEKALCVHEGKRRRERRGLTDMNDKSLEAEAVISGISLFQAMWFSSSQVWQAKSRSNQRKATPFRLRADTNNIVVYEETEPDIAMQER